MSEANRHSVREEVRLLLQEATREGECIRPVQLARDIDAAYPDSGFTASEIAEMIRWKATIAGVKVVSERSMAL
jgi:hypothetical protein